MKRFLKIFWFLITFAVLGLSACGGAATPAKPTVDSAPVFTQIASTALALQTQTFLSIPTETSTPQVSPTPQSTNTPLITNTPLPGTASPSPVALNTPLATNQTSCDNMAYVADVTIPDGYVAARGESMTKTWTIKNLGPCTWNQDYKLIFGWGGQGTNWNTTKPVNLSKLVAPGVTIDVSVQLSAPSAKGEYVGVFSLQNDKGINFPPGQQVTIDIVVK
jgi:hypothetical protein